jgi:hypothetical protein
MVFPYGSAYLGFDATWCNLISNLLCTASHKILVNHQPREEIRHQHGLRQWDPLSPMLFILVMDVLNSIFTKAGEMGLLQPLTRRNLNQRISLYADDVALFIKPYEEEINMTMAILIKFGDASGLQTNLQKSCVIPIRYEQLVVDSVNVTLPCTTTQFPCTYLGLPILDRKLQKADLMQLIEKIGDKSSSWQAAFMNQVGRITWVRFILSAIHIYMLINIKVPKWFIEAVDKLHHAFVWKGNKQVNGGNCLISWDIVQRPLELGGLGIPNLEYMRWALQLQWLWFKKLTRKDPSQVLKYRCTTIQGHSFLFL